MISLADNRNASRSDLSPEYKPAFSDRAVEHIFQTQSAIKSVLRLLDSVRGSSSQELRGKMIDSITKSLLCVINDSDFLLCSEGFDSEPYDLICHDSDYCIFPLIRDIVPRINSLTEKHGVAFEIVYGDSHMYDVFISHSCAMLLIKVMHFVSLSASGTVLVEMDSPSDDDLVPMVFTFKPSDGQGIDGICSQNDFLAVLFCRLAEMGCSLSCNRKPDGYSVLNFIIPLAPHSSGLSSLSAPKGSGFFPELVYKTEFADFL